MSVLLNVVLIVVILLIVWWFWSKRSKGSVVSASAAGVQQAIEVVVANGIYTPSVIKAQCDQPLSLKFIRKDASPCAKIVVFSDFDVTQELTLNQATYVTFTPNKRGEFEFTCDMAMYRGKLIVE